MRKDKIFFQKSAVFFGKSVENRAIVCILSAVRNLKIKKAVYCANEETPRPRDVKEKYMSVYF